ncbi:MAG: diguanylate cyclase [Gammaproteobacteria bacterium]
MSYQKQLLTEQVRLLYTKSQTVTPLNIVIATILVIILSAEIPFTDLLKWWLTITGWCLIRIFHIRSVIKKGDFDTDPRKLLNLFTMSVFITANIWAVLFLEFMFEIPDSHIVFVIFALGGLAVGAVASMLSEPRTFFAYLCPLLIPPTFVYLFQGDTLGFTFSSIMLIYFISLASTYMQGHRLSIDGFQLQLDKDELIQKLKHSNLNLAHANEKIFSLSKIDELTHLANRREMDTTLSKEWALAVRSKLPIAFIMFDIDHFKSYNDTFGHQQGDECLKKIAAVLRCSLKRSGDCVARYGGEEFAAILPGTTLEGAVALAKQVQAEIAELKIPATNCIASTFVTVSAGVAGITPTETDKMADIISRADAALYLAKNSGRNRVEQDA